MESRLGICEMCSKLAAKYTCPRCELNTCSVTCVKSHKDEYGCDGLRDKTAYKPLSKMTDMDLKSDYGLLEEIANSVDTYSRDPAKRLGNRPGDIPKALHFLREAAHRRNMKLWFMPAHFSRRKLNRSYHNFKTKQIEWTTQVLFHLEDKQVKTITAQKIFETSCLKDVILELLKDEEPWTIPFKGDKLASCVILLRAENIKDAMSRMDLEKTVEENLRGYTLVEFPIFLVVPQALATNFNIITIEDVQKEIKEMVQKAAKEKNEEIMVVDIEAGSSQSLQETESMETTRKRARLDIPEYKDICKIHSESDDEMEVGSNFFNL